MDCTEAIVEFCPGNVFTILLSEKYVGIPTALTRVQQYSLPRRVPIDFIVQTASPTALKWECPHLQSWAYLDKVLIFCGTGLDFPEL